MVHLASKQHQQRQGRWRRRGTHFEKFVALWGLWFEMSIVGKRAADL